jgi:uncharacterized cupin superfamily protein
MKLLVNIDDVVLNPMGNGGFLEAKLCSIGPLIGSHAIGCLLTVIPPGKAAFPFHVHHNCHELFVVLEGEGEYRFGEDRHPVRAGHVMAAPASKDRSMAHQIINTGTRDLKFLGISDLPVTDVCDYPDSDKFAVRSHFDFAAPEAGGIAYVGRSANSLDYFDGEK